MVSRYILQTPRIPRKVIQRQLYKLNHSIRPSCEPVSIMSHPSIPREQPPTIGAPLAVPTNGLGAMSAFTVTYSTVIARPPLECLEPVLDTSTWPSWNAFCPRATVTGTPAAERAVLAVDSKERVPQT